MLIAIDIGNSTINIGYFLDSDLLVQKISTYPLCTADVYRLHMSDFLEQNNIEKTFISGIISSVVKSHTEVFLEAVNKLSGNKAIDICVLSHQMDTGLGLKINSPEGLGTDRLASAAAAYMIYRGPVAVIDFGSATTISVVGRDANFIGGSIMPGIGLMNDVLAEKTAKLKKVDLKKAGPALGTDTAESICSGLLFGTAGAVERILFEIEEEIGYAFMVVITGGYADLMDRYIKRLHHINLYLTLEGLKDIYERNRSK